MLCHLKVCISEAAIAQVNNQGGNGLEQLARETSVYIKLAAPGDYFPATMERCLAMSGDQNALITFLWNLGVRSPGVMNSLTLVLPNSAVSAIIGHGGATIKAMQETSGARMKVESRTDGVKERVVRIASTNGENVFKGLRLVLEKISSDPQLGQNLHVTYIDPHQTLNMFQQYMSMAGQVFATGVVMPGSSLAPSATRASLPMPMNSCRKRKVEELHVKKDESAGANPKTEKSVVE